METLPSESVKLETAQPYPDRDPRLDDDSETRDPSFSGLDAYAVHATRRRSKILVLL